MELNSPRNRFETLYSTHSGQVYGYALRQGADRQEAEDVVVETFLVCWRRLDDVPDPGLPWLLGVARRVMANQGRGRRRQVALYKKITASMLRRPRVIADSSSEYLQLKEALASLPDQDREALALVAWQGLTHDAAAQVVGCTRNALTKRYLRARRVLQAQLSSDRTYTSYRRTPPASDEQKVDP